MISVKKTTKLDGCCCEAATMALWSMSLPVNIRAHISNMSFTKDTYKSVFEAADKVFLSAKQVTVAAMSANPSASSALDETLPAFTTQNQPQVAAVGQGRGRGNRGGRGQRGNGRGRGNRGGQSGSASSKPRGPRHASNPPDSCCDRHYVHGDQAFYCLKQG